MKKRLIACKICGAEIAKSAKTCPHCGAKNRAIHPIRGAIASTIAVCACAFTFTIMDSDTEGALQTSSVSGSQEMQAPTSISISATDLWNAYSENKVSADALYKDNLLSVSGTITDIGQDLVSKAPCISLDTGEPLGLYAIQCFFPKNGEQNEVIAALSDGDIVTITGTCNGTPIVHVQLNDCVLQN